MSKPTIVVDANVIVKWFIPEKYYREATLLRDDHLYGRVIVIAPTYAILEYANTLREYVARRILGEEEAREAYNLLVDVMIEYKEITPELTRESLLFGLKTIQPYMTHTM